MKNEAPKFSGVNFDSDEDVAAFIEHQVRKGDAHRTTVNQQAEMAIAWYQGMQNIYWDDRTGQLVKKAEKNRLRVICNQVAPLVDGYVANLGLDEIVPELVPATDDVDDVETARLGTQVAQYVRESQNIGDMEPLCDRWAILTGDAFMKIVWDPYKQTEFPVSPSDLSMENAEFDKTIGASSLSLGDVSISIIPKFNLYWGPRGVPFEEAEWVIEVCERSRAYVMERYDLDEADAPSSASSGDVRVWKANEIGRGGKAQGSEYGDDMVFVAEMWSRPNSRLSPRGRRVLMVGNKVIVNVPNPYKHQSIPYERFTFCAVPGRTSGRTTIDDLLPIQSLVNRNMSQQVENRELMANPVTYVRQGSVVDWEQWNSRPGGVREYNGEMPITVPGVGMPSMVIAELEKELRFAQDAIGLRDASMGKAPTGTRSGRAIIALKDADETRMSPLVKTRRRFWERVYARALQVLSQFVTEERYAKILGEDNRWLTTAYTGDMLTGKRRAPGINYFDVRVRSTGMPKSRAMVVEIADRLIERGFLRPDNESEKRLVFEMLDIGHAEGGIDPARQDRDRQNEECQRMARGEYVKPSLYEDHQVHIASLNKFRKKDLFRRLPPESQGLFDQHQLEHEQMMVINAVRPQMVAQATLQQMGMGQPPAEQPSGGAATPKNSPTVA